MDFILALHKQCKYTDYGTLWNVLKEVVPDFNPSMNWEIRSFADFFPYEKLDITSKREFENMVDILIKEPSGKMIKVAGELQKILKVPRMLHGAGANGLFIMVRKEEMSERYKQEADKLRAELNIDPSCISYQELQIVD